MKKEIIRVEGMSCEHCVKAVKGAVGQLNGVQDVTVDLSARTVAVVYDENLVALADIQSAIEDQGYDVM